MRILAYCDATWERATRKAVGKKAMVLTSPPIYAADFNPAWLEGLDLLYLDLHGIPGSVYLWSGPKGHRSAALSLKTIMAADLRGTVVFLTTCYLPETHFLRAFLDAGAKAVIGGAGENWGTSRGLSGAQRLAKWLIRFLRRGKSPEEALRLAKRALRWLPTLHLKARRDALEFQIWTQEQGEDKE